MQKSILLARPPPHLVSILPSPYLEYHVIEAPPTTVILFHHRLAPIIPPHNDTHGDELVDHLLLSEQLISM
jgi:hypothetical protein